MNPPSFRLHGVLSPLPPADLFEPGGVFPAEELRYRVLSVFWRDCCDPFRGICAPVPVFERAGAESEETSPVLNLWWLAREGIVPGCVDEGAHVSPLYLANAPEAPRPWPRYDFCISTSPFDVEMMFHRSALASQGHRTRLFVQPDGRVRVLARSEWWVA